MRIMTGFASGNISQSSSLERYRDVDSSPGCANSVVETRGIQHIESVWNAGAMHSIFNFQTVSRFAADHFDKNCDCL